MINQQEFLFDTFILGLLVLFLSAVAVSWRQRDILRQRLLKASSALNSASSHIGTRFDSEPLALAKSRQFKNICYN